MRILGICMFVLESVQQRKGVRDTAAFKAGGINRARDQGVRSSGHSDPKDVFWYCNVCIKYQARKGVAACPSLGAVY